MTDCHDEPNERASRRDLVGIVVGSRFASATSRVSAARDGDDASGNFHRRSFRVCDFDAGGTDLGVHGELLGLGWRPG